MGIRMPLDFSELEKIRNLWELENLDFHDCFDPKPSVGTTWASARAPIFPNWKNHRRPRRLGGARCETKRGKSLYKKPLQKFFPFFLNENKKEKQLTQITKTFAKNLNKNKTKNDKNKKQHSFFNNPKLCRVILQRCHFVVAQWVLFAIITDV